ncbi:zinc finger CHY domain protein [Halosimplex carlsbadense 2-9-1]|uniref:Zinc finger CHY domain protein n=1 Tax=Halosimplex carlsbadense 2-9-1 TaxID=797114 RepID=M0D625_9EURY|nr:CHY zinc finger protein [Halosimplex carlsbadense]ELZ29589.1 zinc finger CHY domain protein [Halosimplex carlsbadense 2-9-1]
MTADPDPKRRTTRPPETDERFSVPLRGVDVDAETRCGHYDDPVDVVAIRFPCCGSYYPCFRCHDALTDHGAERIPREAFDDPAVFCGACGATLSVREYLTCDDACPACDAAFNPGCRRHREQYFAVEE